MVICFILLLGGCCYIYFLRCSPSKYDAILNCNTLLYYCDSYITSVALAQTCNDKKCTTVVKHVIYNLGILATQNSIINDVEYGFPKCA